MRDSAYVDERCENCHNYLGQYNREIICESCEGAYCDNCYTHQKVRKSGYDIAYTCRPVDTDKDQ